jgi:DNA-binding MurR/RpiR family transcriptional regulator
MENISIIKRIQDQFASMSKGQRAIAQYIQENYDKAAFMTAHKLGQKAGVSESTVVRFANLLGYTGYPKLQKSLQEMIRNKLTSVQRIEMSSSMPQDEILWNVLKSDMINIRNTIEEIDAQAFDQVVSAILNANRVYVLGVRSAEPLAQFMAHYLNYIVDNVQLVTLGLNDIYEQLIRLTQSDVCIGISFPRYSARTVEGMRYAQEQNATVVAITDSNHSPLAEIADFTLLAKSDMVSFVDSLVAPLSVINALLVAAGNQRKDTATDYFSKLEGLWGLHSVYSLKDK